MPSEPVEKVYIEILKKIKSIISEDGLQPGDKLPSERELTDRLCASRSSVREAFRALELLGLIETRRGEGTFIREATGHRLVEVLASFILNDTKAQEDLAETRHIIIKDCVELTCSRISDEETEHLEVLAREAESVPEAARKFEKLFVQSGRNHLLYRLYVELNGYDTAFTAENSLTSEDCQAILKALRSKDSMTIADILKKQTMN
ncbi:FadR/GntR family transcriptional regulator [Fictibacillus iocasae]|uniref:FadR/GntR family transcriptional regulator n=1 Tax=Fictibacillus iocasae TaxID=2715437 RepID=A0ABW2NVJ0_9BACL